MEEYGGLVEVCDEAEVACKEIEDVDCTFLTAGTALYSKHRSDVYLKCMVTLIDNAGASNAANQIHCDYDLT